MLGLVRMATNSLFARGDPQGADVGNNYEL